MSVTFQSGFKATIAVKVNPADTSIELSTAPTKTKGRIYLSNGAQEEWISYTWVTGTTLTWCTRWLSKTADPSTSGTGLTWIAGTTVKLVAMQDQLLDKQQDETITGSWNFWSNQGKLRLPVYTTTQRDAASRTDWSIIYNSTTGTLQQYLWGAWSTIGNTGTPFATTTSAGTSQTATDTNVTNWDTVGSSWANLSVTPAQLKTTNDNLAAEALKIKSKVDVKAMALVNITISNPWTSTFDSYSASNWDRILLPNQTSGAENGIYIFNWSGSAMTRATDFDNNVNNEVDFWAEICVQWGTVWAWTKRMLSTTWAITVWTTALTFVRTYPIALVSCKATQSSATNASAWAWTSIAFNTEAWDLASIHDTSTNNTRLTIPSWLWWYWEFKWNVWSSNNYTGARILKNGTTVIALQQVWDTVAYTGANTPNTFNPTGIDNPVATDYYELQVYCKTSATNTDTNNTWFSAFKIW